MLYFRKNISLNAVFYIMLLLLLCSYINRCVGDDPDVDLRKKIESLIIQLSDDNEYKQETAQKELEEIGEPAVILLKKTMHNAAPETKEVITLILKVIEIRKNIKFSNNFIHWYPDIYRQLVTSTTAQKFRLLCEIAERDVSTFRYKNLHKATNSDMACLINNILSSGWNDLTVPQKRDIFAVMIGDDDYVNVTYHLKGRLMGWHSPLPETHHHLIKFMEVNNEDIQCPAINAAVEFNYRQAIPTLMGILRKKEGSAVLLFAADALLKFDVKEAFPDIMKLLNNPSADVRECAVNIVSDLPVNPAGKIPEIIKLLKDSEGMVRASAAGALGRLGVKEMIPELTKLLQDNEKRVQIAAAASLAFLGEVKTLPFLQSFLKDEDDQIREHVADLLGELKYSESVPDLVILLNDEMEIVRQRAAFSLSKIGDKKAVPAVIKFLSNRGWSIGWLESINMRNFVGKDAIPSLKQVLNDKTKSKEEHGLAAISLIVLGENNPALKDFIPAIKYISEQGEIQKKWALIALEKLGVDTLDSGDGKGAK